jgi:hypothetical protein
MGFIILPLLLQLQSDAAPLAEPVDHDIGISIGQHLSVAAAQLETAPVAQPLLPL